MNFTVYKHLLGSYGKNPGEIFGFCLGVIRALVMRIYVVTVIADITTYAASGDFNAAKRSAIYFLLLSVGGALLGALGDWVAMRSENKQYYRMAIAYYQKLIGKDMSFYRDNLTGYLASMFRQYLDGSIQMVRWVRGELMFNVLWLIAPPIVLFTKSPQLGLIATAIIVIQVIYVLWASGKVNKYRHLSNEVYRKVTGIVSDEITNIVAYKSGGMDVAESQAKMQALQREENAYFQKRFEYVVLFDLPRNIVTGVGVSLAIYYILSTTGTGNPQSIGLIVLTITYMFQILRNVATLPDAITRHDDMVTKLYPTLQYLGPDYETIKDPEHPVALNLVDGTVTLEDVSFGYVSGVKKDYTVPVFSALNLTIKGGEQIGVVGLSGAGKSTLTSLLLRFDEVTSGSIKIDGINIRDIKQSELRKAIAYVPQEPLLFHRTIRENILYYNPNATEAEVIRAAEAAHAHEFILNLPDGYDTLVGERGVKLSGGQKQRVVIARAILKQARIMIFDEATSALDSESEQIIQRALPEIIGKQTAIVVAHRLSTVAGLDRIIVMHEGKIVEQGTHDELLVQRGRYYSLWQKQTTEFGS